MLEEKGFDIKLLNRKTLSSGSFLLSKISFENQIIGDYELIFLKEKSNDQYFFRIEKINYWNEYKKLVQQARKLIKEKFEIDNTLHAFKFDSDISSPEGVVHYEKEKIKIEMEIKELVAKMDLLSNAFNSSVEYFKRELLK